MLRPPVASRSEGPPSFGRRILRWLQARLSALWPYPSAGAIARAEAARRESEEKFRQAFASANIGMCLVSLEGRLLEVNAHLGEIFGYSPAELAGMSIDDLTLPEDRDISAGYIQRALAGEDTTAVFEKRYRHRDGHIFDGQVSSSLVRDSRGRPLYFISQVQDISERKRTALELQRARDAAEAANRALQAANRELELLAATDPLTGLWNRRQLDQWVRREIDRADRYGVDLSLLLFDIDHFKAINDRFGHPAGDRVLVELARRLQGQLRRSDDLGRWGGEEFLVLLPECSAVEAWQLAEKLRRLLADTPFEGVGLVTASFGVAQRRPGEVADDWFRRVDRALYRAKEQGRNRVALDEEAPAPVCSPEEPQRPGFSAGPL